jgi:hypothetical protein
MKMCLAPCYKGCTDERYAEEAMGVQDFLATRGESKLVVLRDEREAASARLAFEDAATLHAQVQKVEAVRALAPELVQPLSRLRAVILQPPAAGPTVGNPLDAAQPSAVAVFLYQSGMIRGPILFSTIGMRIQNEQSGSSSLFAQPMALEAVPEDTGNREQGIGNNDQERVAQEKVPRTMLEARMEAVLAELEEDTGPPSATVRQGHLALLKRWYYRPEVKREGEVCFPGEHGQWPIKSMLRAAGRVAAKSLTHATRA